MSRFSDLLGTSLSKFMLGLGGPQVKASSGKVQARNSADSLFATMEAALFATYGNDFELNSGAAASGADWKFTIRRPSTGQTEAIILVMPVTTPSVGQALTVATYSAGLITLQWTTVAAGTDKVVSDTTSLAFGTTSPLAMYNHPVGAIIKQIQVVIDTPFNGAPSLSIGITGTTSKYAAATLIDLTAAATTVFDIAPGLLAVGGIEAIIATYSAGGASAGAARIVVDYVIPS